MGDPFVERTPATSFRSFTANGSPCRYPGGASSGAPDAINRAACSRARSTASVGSAFTAPSTSEMRSTAASIISSGDTSRVASRPTASRAVIRTRSFMPDSRRSCEGRNLAAEQPRHSRALHAEGGISKALGTEGGEGCLIPLP